MPWWERLTIRGQHLRAEVREAVIGAPQVSFSTEEASQVTFSLVDPEWALVHSGLFDGRPTVQWDKVPLEVAVVEPGPGPGGEQVTVHARPRGVQTLKRRQGALVRRNVSPTDWMGMEMRSVGMTWYGQPSQRRPQIAREAPTGTPAEDRPTAWDTLRRLADEVGYWLYESDGATWFGRPTWLVGKAPRTWDVAWPPASGKVTPVRAPTLRRSDDAPHDVEVALELMAEEGRQVRAGHAVTLSGVPGPWAKRFIVTRVEFTDDGTSPVNVDAVVPRDPTPSGAG